MYKPIDANEIDSLLVLAKSGDSDATEKLVQGNFPLIKSIVKGFLNKGIEYDDLYQLGCVGFLKAIKNFDGNVGVKFSTYAVPMIAGEIKRFLRDDGMIKVSRSIKTLAIKIKTLNEKLKSEGKEPLRIDELAKRFNVDTEDVVVTDFGVGIDDIDMALQPFFTSKADEEHSGMGFTLMDSFMNELSVEKNKPSGLIVRMQKVIKK